MTKLRQSVDAGAELEVILVEDEDRLVTGIEHGRGRIP
jgi:hypothetical protein